MGCFLSFQHQQDGRRSLLKTTRFPTRSSQPDWNTLFHSGAGLSETHLTQVDRAVKRERAGTRIAQGISAKPLQCGGINRVGSVFRVRRPDRSMAA
jgi:hypothetical protein